jgi:hypothetical protein
MFITIQIYDGQDRYRVTCPLESNEKDKLFLCQDCKPRSRNT